MAPRLTALELATFSEADLSALQCQLILPLLVAEVRRLQALLCVADSRHRVYVKEDMSLDYLDVAVEVQAIRAEARAAREPGKP